MRFIQYCNVLKELKNQAKISKAEISKAINLMDDIKICTVQQLMLNRISIHI